MWSHYADAHKGVCVGFDPGKLYISLKDKDNALIVVKYTDNLDAVEYFMETYAAMKNWLGTKAKQWAYEREIRIALFQLELDLNKQTLVHFQKQAINSIILGSKINIEDEKNVLAICRRDYPLAKKFKMELAKDNFRLIRHKIN
jgi:hypothetical protein